MKKCVLLVLLGLLCLSGMAQDQLYPVTGKVTVKGTPLPGAYIGIKSSGRYTVTDESGSFLLGSPAGKQLLVLRFMGYMTQEIEIMVPLESDLELEMQEDALQLEGVEIISTGYAEIPKERATGSFVTLDNELVNRRISTSILDRLEDVTPGVLFSRGVGSSLNKLTIRGRSTLFASTQPLVILDNFPYDGPIEQINPNDIESITVLRDAAAASIWGARAGNGVIVLTSKKGKKNEDLRVSFNSNVTLVEQPDLFYVPRMSSSDFIDVEQQLFGEGYYKTAINSAGKTPVSPVVELLLAAQNGELSEAEAQNKIDFYRTKDIRDDQKKYLYQQELRQQYALNLRGGGAGHRFYLSAGHDRNREALVRNSLARTTINSNVQLDLIPDRLLASAGIYLSQSRIDRSNPGEGGLDLAGSHPSPYTPLADGSGKPLSIASNYNNAAKRDAVERGLLDWALVPLEELYLLDDTRESHDLRLNASLDYQVVKGLHLETSYQYWQNSTTGEDWWDEDSYASRNRINSITQVDEFGGLSYPLPKGGILTTSDRRSSSHNLRLKADYTKDWGEGTVLKALGGYEVKALGSEGHSGRYYGVSEETGINRSVDYVTRFPQYINPRFTSRISYAGDLSGANDNFISYFGNASFTWRNRYILSGSARKDASNLFGVNANQKGVPLYSAGASWLISEEEFARWSWLPFWKVRLTYGVNGNIDKSVTAFTTSQIFGTSRLTNLPEGTLTYPANPNLQWETIKILNLGTDFSLWEDKLSGSFEYYLKNGDNLIGDFAVAPSNGRSSYRGNFASTQTKGFDLNIELRPWKSDVQWTGIFFLSMVDEKVTEYELEASAQTYLGSGAGLNQSSVVYPLKGKPLYSVYSLPWAGLDPVNGDPQGYLDGELSTDYAGIINGATPENLTYHGPSTPKYFGAFRNQVDYKGFSLSMNITFRLGYYYKRTSIYYNQLLTGKVGHGDYAERWQKPGDELVTQVPSQPEARNFQRDNFYNYSSELVEKGDHIRLQDIRLSYSPQGALMDKLPFRRVNMYAYASNLGIIWKASNDELDPDFLTSKSLASLSMGIQIDF